MYHQHFRVKAGHIIIVKGIPKILKILVTKNGRNIGSCVDLHGYL